jgi:nitrite reductase/ring-hydroxylating ferredoxin subunit
VCGIIGALLAAIPGAVDYFKTVPPNSSAKKRATKHALLNITNLVLFLIAWILKGNNINPYVILVLELIGIILLAIAGWLGGTLVYRNQIGVDPRYANAGKWKEEEKDETKGQIKVASTDELKTDQMKLIHVNDKRIVIARTEKGYVAFDDHCTHKGGSLAGGAMICETVQCPWHGSQFDVNTGAVKAGPAKEKINTYNVSETNGKVYLNL